jgi:hypothetical protein
MQKSVPGEALRAISDEGLSVREAVEWCSTGITVLEVTRLRRLARNPAGRPVSARRLSAAGLAR